MGNNYESATLLTGSDYRPRLGFAGGGKAPPLAKRVAITFGGMLLGTPLARSPARIAAAFGFGPIGSHVADEAGAEGAEDELDSKNSTDHFKTSACICRSRRRCVKRSG
jgi:hypothetical protein